MKFSFGSCCNLDDVQIISLEKNHIDGVIERLKCMVSILLDVHIYIRKLLSTS